MEAVEIIKGKSYSRVTAAGAQDWPRTASAQNGLSWQLSSPLPPGMSISYNAGTYGTGDNIVGTPTTAGRWTGTAELFIYGDGPLDYESFDITVYDSPIITAGQSFTGAAGAAIDIRPTLDNSTYRPASGWSANGLPAGLTLTELDGGKNCKITGTAAVGTYTVTLTAAGASGYPITSQTANSDTETITITITAGAPYIDRSNAYFPGKVGESFNATLLVTDPVNRPVTSWSWEYTIPGLSLNTSTGVISGTPTTKFEHSIYLTATGPGGTDTAPFNIPIVGGTPIITSGQTGSGKVGEAFSKTFSLTDSTNRPVTSWAATGLPAWASLNASTGAITGTPTAMGSFSASLTATGEGGTSQITSVTFSIAAGTPIIQAGQSASGKVGDSFSKTFSLTDSANRPVTSWVITGLPSGLSYNSTTGAISGTPTATGSSNITLTATGPGGSDTETAPITITVGAPSITPGQTGSGKVGEAFSKTFSLTDSANRPVTSWSATGLPSWATLNTTTGAITGTPQDTGSTTITLTATGPGGADTETAAISIAAGPPIIVSGQSFTGKVGEAFTSATLSLDDAADRPATSWSATGLPAGLTLNTATGAITGTPTTKGTSTASFTATGGGGTSAASTVAFTISEGAPIITAGQTLSGTVGTAFIRTPALTDATNRPATSWTATALPAWATLNATTGAIMGIPTAAAITTITLTATGPGGVDTETASISISTSGGGGGGGGTTTPTMQLTPQQDFAATLGIAFNRTPTILSGTPTSWYATGLPAWATINATTGAITGTPNFTGVNIVTVTAQDSSGSVSSTSITLTTVSWNTLEVFIDPRARKILSRANTRSVMQKMFLKRDDLVNFQIVFVNDDQPFGLPSDFAVTVGIKASYASEDFIAFSDSVNGTLSLASDPVQDLFADEPDTVEAIFEVKWEDETSASRTASLPVIIQNTILRGNTADPGATTGGGGFTASGLSKYLAARQKILTGETAETTTLTLSEPLAGEAIFHRPLANNLPDHRGWITGVSAVSLQGDTGTEALVAGEDFVFYPDRQCFYFTQDQTGVAKFSGAATQNFLNFTISCEKNILSSSSHVPTSVDASAEGFQITGIEIKNADGIIENPQFFFDKSTNTVLFETAFTTYMPRFNVRRTSAKKFWVARNGVALGNYTDVSIKQNYEEGKFVDTDYFYDDYEWVLLQDFPFDTVGENFQETDLGFFTPSQIQSYLADGTLSGTDYYGGGEDWMLLSGFSYTADASVLCKFLTESGEEIEVSFLNLSNESRISIPKNIVTGKSLTACLSVQALLAASKFYNIPAFVLEKTPGSAEDILHLGWGYPSISATGEFNISATFTPQGNGPADTFLFQFINTPSNLIELPQSLSNVSTFSFKKESDANFTPQLIVFSEDQQKLYFPKTRSGNLTYTAQHSAYQGLAAGGEEIEIIAEIPGIFATTAGTGHSISTLRTLTPTRDNYSYWKTKNRDLVQIVDDQSAVIYQDEGPEALFYSRPGYTSPDINPVTPKLPLSVLYPLSPRDDTSFIHVAFTPDFVSSKFASATYTELDDTQRYASDSIAPGKTLTISTNVSVRGLQGVGISGPKPTFYSGALSPKITLSTYKWFVVKCKNAQGNTNISQGARYLLCVNNVHYDTQAILVNITDSGYNVAADLFPL